MHCLVEEMHLEWPHILLMLTSLPARLNSRLCKCNLCHYTAGTDITVVVTVDALIIMSVFVVKQSLEFSPYQLPGKAVNRSVGYIGYFLFYLKLKEQSLCSEIF